MADNPRQDLYLEISRNLVDVELTDLRNYVSGAKILPAGFVQKADAHQIFNQLEKEHKLKPGDLSLLASLLRRIGWNDYAEQAEEIAEDERKEEKRLKVSDPRQDLYLEISRNIDERELEDLRNYVSGARILPARFVERATGHQIFNQLEKEQKLKPGDLSLLAGIFRKIGRHDYAEQAEKIAENERKVDVSRYFDNVIHNVSHLWDDLARKLGFTRNEIQSIQAMERDPDRRCREMLNRWRNREGKYATLQALKRALINIGEMRTAERLEDSSYSSESSDEDDQERSSKSGQKTGGTSVDVSMDFDKVIHGASANWDELARKLNFTENEIEIIQAVEPDNDRRCREMLRRWRNREGKAATLQVLKRALVGIGQRRTAELLKDSSYSLESSDEDGQERSSMSGKKTEGTSETFQKLKHLLTEVRVEDDSRTDTYDRLAESGLTFRAEVPKDGNCMFHAVADQLLRTEGRRISHVGLRQQVVDYLRQNPHNANGDHLSAFVSDQNWEGYLSTMSRDGTWGDHIVLQAMADMFGHDVSIVSSVEAENYVTILTPSTGTVGRKESPLLLGHYAENHYASLDEYSSVPMEIQLRGPRMQKLYSEACRRGTGRVHSLRALVVGKFESGKTCLVKRLTGEEPVENEQITDGIEISPSVNTQTWRKATAEPDDFKETVAQNLADWIESEADQETPSPPEETDEQESKRKDDTEAENIKEETENPVQQTQREQPSEKKETRSQRKETHKRRSEDEKHGGKEGDSREKPTPTPLIPDDILMGTKKRLQGGVTEEQLGTAEYPRISFWDFGGQAAYYGSHQCFHTYRGIYILVMSLLQKLSDPVPDLDYQASADNLMTGKDYLDYWVNCVRTHTLVHGREKLGEPPIILVLTNKDQVNEVDIEDYMKKIQEHIEKMPEDFRKHINLKIFVIDNFSDDSSTFDELRNELREVAKGMWYMGQEVPITWLHLKSKLMDKRGEDDPFCSFQDVVHLARSVDITDVSEVPGILTFLHDLGDIIFIDEPVLRDHVALRPQVMIDVFKTIITVPQYQQGRATNEKIGAMWKRLENEGILSEELLTSIWTTADKKLPFLLRNKVFLKRLMEKYYLICNATPPNKSKQEEIYFVPSLLAAKPDEDTLYPPDMARFRSPLYVVFENMFLPSGMFYRLQAICVRRFGLGESSVYAGCARFPTDDAKQHFVLTKVKVNDYSYLKVELLSADKERPVFTEGLPVRKFLSSCLFDIKEKWIPSIQYDWCTLEEQEQGRPAFRPLPDTGHEAEMESSRFSKDFVEAWMDGSCDQRASCAENSGGTGPVMIQPTLRTDDVSPVRTIGPILECLETCGGLTLGQCDSIRRQPTYVGRFTEMVAIVNNNGDASRRMLGASLEICRPEIAPLFPREERGNEVVVLHVGDYNDKLLQPLLQEVVKSSSRYGVCIREDVIKSGDVITKKVLDHLLRTSVRMVIPVITPEVLHEKHWSKLGYEFSVQNQNMVFPEFVYPAGHRERLRDALRWHCPLMLEMTSAEVSVTEEQVSSTKVGLLSAEILNKASTSVELNTFIISTDACTFEEHGVTIVFPEGCVMSERALSLEVEALPTNDTMTSRFSAVTSMLTVHHGQEKGFLAPVTVTLPWTWKSDGDLGRTVIMRRSGGGQWSLLTTEIQETAETVTFTTDQFSSIVGAKTTDNDAGSSTSADSTGKQEEAAVKKATDDIHIVVTEYSEDTSHLIINPNQATEEENSVHLLCLRKGDRVEDFFRAPNLQSPSPVEVQVVMHKNERIRAWFGEDEDVIGDSRDIPRPDGILFVYPPANRNRFSVRLKLQDTSTQTRAGRLDGKVHFTLLSEAGEPVSDPRRTINPVLVHFLIQQGTETRKRLRSAASSSDQEAPVKRGKQHPGAKQETGRSGRKTKDAAFTNSPSSGTRLSKSTVKRRKSPQPSCSSAKGATTSGKSSGSSKHIYFTDSSNSSDEDSPDVSPARRQPTRTSSAKGQKTKKRSAASVSLLDRKAPAKRRNQHKGAKKEAGRSGRKTKVDVSKYFDKVIRGASADWDELARKLKFGENEIKEIEDEKRGNRRRCREMLERWRNRKSKVATIEVLKKALAKIGHQLTADRLEGKSNSGREQTDDSDSGASGNSSESFSDDDDGKIIVKVQPCTDAFWKRTIKKKRPYKMGSLPRGYALILCNTKFKKSAKRKGGDVDLDNMKTLFEGLSFKPHILQKKKAREIKDEIRAFSKMKEHEEMDCCIVVLMSHGSKGVIAGTDNKPVQLDDIFTMFDNENCPLLKGKPKLFFIQACRGKKVDKGVAAHEDDDDSSGADPNTYLRALLSKLLHLSAPEEDETDGPEVIPTRTDMLCCYATQLGHKAYRCNKNGSWFIQAITKVFMEHAKDNSLLEMMTKVIAKVSKRTSRSSSKPTISGGKEVAEFVSNLHKTLYFFPGAPFKKSPSSRKRLSKSTAKRPRSPQPSCSSAKGTTTSGKSSGASKHKHTSDSSNSSDEDSPDVSPRRQTTRKSSAKGQKARKRPTASDSSSDQEAPVKRRQQEAGRSGRETKVDVSKYFDKVIRGTSANWDDLARKLNFEENEIDGIEDRKRDNDSRCREVLKRWGNREEDATLQALKKALIRIGHRRTAENLED